MNLKVVSEAIDTARTGTPVYRQVANSLRDYITSGELAPGFKLPPEVELAASLGINHLTLRKSLRILADQKLISQHKGKGTFIAYSNNIQMRVGIICRQLNKINNDFYELSMISAITCQLNSRSNGEIVLIDAHEQRPAALLEKINQQRCDSLIVLNSDKKITDMMLNQAFDYIPIVFINNPYSLPEDGMRYHVRLKPNAITIGLDYLTGLGHRKIAYVGSEHSINQTTTNRNAEFLTYGLENDMVFIARHGELWYDFSREKMNELCHSPNRPTAILCPGAAFSYGAWMGIIEAGCRIPEDISFIGLDAASSFNPHMSALEQPVDKITAKAIDLLADMRGAGKHLKQHLYEYPVEIIERNSCRKIN